MPDTMKFSVPVFRSQSCIFLAMSEPLRVSAQIPVLWSRNIFMRLRLRENIFYTAPAPTLLYNHRFMDCPLQSQLFENEPKGWDHFVLWILYDWNSYKYEWEK
jgi:hypothetical protein